MKHKEKKEEEEVKREKYQLSEESRVRGKSRTERNGIDQIRSDTDSSGLGQGRAGQGRAGRGEETDRKEDVSTSISQKYTYSSSSKGRSWGCRHLQVRVQQQILRSIDRSKEANFGGEANCGRWWAIDRRRQRGRGGGDAMGGMIQQNCCKDTFWMYIGAIVGLLAFSGLMSGLTLGLMSLGLVDLEVLRRSGKPDDRRHAAKILPVVRNQHLLLVTLLVGNAMAMEALPLFLDSVVDTYVAIILSVTLLLMFGEILPQAVCSRYGLAVGAAVAPLVRVLLFVMFPVAFPLSKMLDWMLGEKHALLFGRAELRTLVDMHSHAAGNGGQLSRSETSIISGALQLGEKTAGHAMTPLGRTFSVDLHSRLDRAALARILASGHSRVPVFAGAPSNLVGLVLVKSLLCVDRPRDDVPVAALAIRPIPRVAEATPLYDLLHEFLQGRSHMAAVREHSHHAPATGLANGSVPRREEIWDEKDRSAGELCATGIPEDRPWTQKPVPGQASEQPSTPKDRGPMPMPAYRRIHMHRVLFTSSNAPSNPSRELERPKTAPGNM
ncbi:hypothetical protein AXG93_3457s1340 [Marchantia polymorpha subsp. ruderalis]|uniref:CNNM transmembrane domain-containing protein n=1 Tax=Marchantia polymorpha subsp. ruderalis TaxID=1480154 RepID=A0A176VZJ8_MARPO|nr:hypothetical protein AXG93_3457s1340 [Marchantia polymorpha subsp. ruderalis]